MHDSLGGGGMHATQRHAHGVGLHVHLDLHHAAHAQLLARGGDGSGAQGGGAVDHVLRGVRQALGAAELQRLNRGNAVKTTGKQVRTARVRS